jgi:hypothetical protein
MTYVTTSTDRDEITQRAVEGRPLWNPTAAEQALMDVQRVLDARKDRGVEIVDMDFRGGVEK